MNSDQTKKNYGHFTPGGEEWFTFLFPFHFIHVNRRFVCSPILLHLFFLFRAGSISLLHHILLFFSLCVQFNPASTSPTAIPHHAILVLIPMPKSHCCHAHAQLFFFSLAPSTFSPCLWGNAASARFPCIERSPHPSHALHFHLLPLLIPRTALLRSCLGTRPVLSSRPCV
jgi:hypothetical protein